MCAMSLVPSFFSNRPLARRPEEADSFLSFRRDMDRLFDDLFANFGMPTWRGQRAGQAPGMMLAPQIDMSETDREIRIAAELPGLDQKDIEVTLTDDLLTIRGEKKAQQEDKQQDYHLMERSYGTFTRYLRLPFTVDPSQVQASFKDGVLTITLPKPENLQQKAAKIEVKKADGEQAGASGGQSSGQGESKAAAA
jgi:HSP20 family protein